MPHDYVQADKPGPPDFTNIELADVIDVPALQEMMDDYYALTGIGVGIVDLNGTVLVGTGWQDICVRFHRAASESCAFCHESDTSLSSGVPPGTFKEYRCNNNMWDIATPIMLGDRHIGNIFLGQFLYDDEEPDYELFRAQARRFGYDEAEYLTALDRVPRWSRETVRKAMNFYAKLARMISQANYTNVILADTLARREQAEEALQWARISVESASDALFWVAPDARIVDVNAAACRSLGYTREELLQLRVPDFDPHFDASMWPKQFATLRRYGSMTFESEHRTKDGRIFPVEIVANHVNFGSEERHCAFVRDITERKRTEEDIERLNTDLAARATELETANIELEAFNYSVSHDLRKPLTVINSYCQMVQDLCGNRLDEQCKDFLREMHEATLRMNRLIDTLLEFSRVTRVEIHHEKVDLSRMAEEVALQLKVSAPERRVTFRITEGVVVDGDTSLLRVVLDNLVGNAWKFTVNREEAVIEFGVTEFEGKPACFVRDNGSGFDMKHAEKLFVPFKRLPGTNVEGYGVGLATVERIVKRHGGRVWAEGEREKGATFSFTLS